MISLDVCFGDLPFETRRSATGHLCQKLDAKDWPFVSKVVAGTHAECLEKSVWTWVDASL